MFNFQKAIKDSWINVPYDVSHISANLRHWGFQNIASVEISLYINQSWMKTQIPDLIRNSNSACSLYAWNSVLWSTRLYELSNWSYVNTIMWQLHIFYGHYSVFQVWICSHIVNTSYECCKFIKKLSELIISNATRTEIHCIRSCASLSSWINHLVAKTLS